MPRDGRGDERRCPTPRRQWRTDCSQWPFYVRSTGASGDQRLVRSPASEYPDGCQRLPVVGPARAWPQSAAAICVPPGTHPRTAGTAGTSTRSLAGHGNHAAPSVVFWRRPAAHHRRDDAHELRCGPRSVVPYNPTAGPLPRPTPACRPGLQAGWWHQGRSPGASPRDHGCPRM